MPWHDVTFDLAFANGAVLLAGIVLYALLGGADFGGGIWDLLARGSRADHQRQEIARAIGPIWEANHVWLIFSLVAAFTVFPKVFAIVCIALYIPLSLALLGIVLRGAAFVFRAYAHDVTLAQQGWGGVFAISSTVTPVFLGMCAGAVASGKIRVVDGEFRGQLLDHLALALPDRDRAALTDDLRLPGRGLPDDRSARQGRAGGGFSPPRARRRGRLHGLSP